VLVGFGAAEALFRQRMIGCIIGLLAKADQVDHLDRVVARQVLEHLESGAFGIDVVL
jgi:hypothetical protein